MGGGGRRRGALPPAAWGLGGLERGRLGGRKAESPAQESLGGRRNPPRQLTAAASACSINAMAYPGDRTLDAKVQQRILAAFGEAVRLYREQHPDEARTILRSIVEVDPRFIPAQRLDMAIEANAPVNLSEMLAEISAAAPVSADEIVARAREALAAGDFQGALVLTQNLLRDLPGHAEGRKLALEAQNRLRVASEAEAQARRAREGAGSDSARIPRAPSDGRGASAGGSLAEFPAGEEVAAEFNEVGEGADEFQFEFLDDASPGPGSPSAGLYGGPTQRAAAEPKPSQPREGGGLVFENRSAVPGLDFGAAEGARAPLEESVFVDEESGYPGAGDDERVRALLERGRAAFARGAYQEAIDTWSRVFLIDTHHAEAEGLIEQARRRREEVERLAEHNFYEAREAFDRGELEEARRYCTEVLKLQPQHFEAHDLLQRLETPAAPPPTAPQALAVHDDDDIFRDDFVSAPRPSMATPSAPARELALPPPRRAAPARRGFALPSLPRPVLGAAAAVVIVGILVAGAFMIGGRVFSGDGGGVADALAEAERLASQDRLQDAINLLQSLDIEGPQGQEVTQRVLELRRQLRARPSPTPALDTSRIREAISSGRRLTAMTLVREVRARAPGSPELDAIAQELALYSAALPAASEAVAQGQWEIARQRLAQILREHPDDGFMQQAWEAATFNHAVSLLQRYEIAVANSVLTELAGRSRDGQVARLKDLASSYLSRPVDPKYEIFVGSLEFRRVE